MAFPCHIFLPTTWQYHGQAVTQLQSIKEVLYPDYIGKSVCGFWCHQGVGLKPGKSPTRYTTDCKEIFNGTKVLPKEEMRCATDFNSEHFHVWKKNTNMMLFLSSLPWNRKERHNQLLLLAGPTKLCGLPGGVLLDQRIRRLFFSLLAEVCTRTEFVHRPAAVIIFLSVKNRSTKAREQCRSHPEENYR